MNNFTAQDAKLNTERFHEKYYEYYLVGEIEKASKEGKTLITEIVYSWEIDGLKRFLIGKGFEVVVVFEREFLTYKLKIKW